MGQGGFVLCMVTSSDSVKVSGCVGGAGLGGGTGWICSVHGDFNNIKVSGCVG